MCGVVWSLLVYTKNIKKTYFFSNTMNEKTCMYKAELHNQKILYTKIHSSELQLEVS